MSSSKNPFIEVHVASVMQEGANQRSFLLAASDGAPLPAYTAGAHVDIHIAPDLVRQYSLIRGATHDQYQVCVKRQSHSRGGSHRLYDIKVGTRLKISSPRNHFSLRGPEPAVLVAGGIGITPIISLALEMASTQQAFVLHYYVKSPEDAIFRETLMRRLPPDRIVMHFSSQGDSLRMGLPKDLLGISHGSRVYACGPTGLIQTLRTALQAQGFPEEQFHTESFTPTAVEAAGEESDFVVQIASTGQAFTVPHDCSIADVLQRNGVAVSLSCEQGMCGACLTPVIDGIPDHRDTVLSKQERSANNTMAICCSRSLSPRIVLDLQV